MNNNSYNCLKWLHKHGLDINTMVDYKKDNTVYYSAPNRVYDFKPYHTESIKDTMIINKIKKEIESEGLNVYYVVCSKTVLGKRWHFMIATKVDANFKSYFLFNYEYNVDKKEGKYSRRYFKIKSGALARDFNYEH